MPTQDTTKAPTGATPSELAVLLLELKWAVDSTDDPMRWAADAMAKASNVGAGLRVRAEEAARASRHLAEVARAFERAAAFQRAIDVTRTEAQP